jgi:hypothetical protein
MKALRRRRGSHGDATNGTANTEPDGNHDSAPFGPSSCCIGRGKVENVEDDDGDGEDEEDLTCGICLEPLGPPRAYKAGIEAAAAATAPCRRKKFGLLSACDHIFCLQCLRTWRSGQKREAAAAAAAGGNDDGLLESLLLAHNDGGDPQSLSSSSERVRACPTCRQVSDFVVPSDRYCKGPEKDLVVRSYQARLSSIGCKRFTGELGSCPFGRDCFYGHWHPRDGRDMKPMDKSRQQLWQERQRRKLLQQLRQHEQLQREIDFFNLRRRRWSRRRSSDSQSYFYLEEFDARHGHTLVSFASTLATDTVLMDSLDDLVVNMAVEPLACFGPDGGGGEDIGPAQFSQRSSTTANN